MVNVLIVGATRGLGAELAKLHHDLGHSVYATTRSSSSKFDHGTVQWVENVDLMHPDVGENVVKGLEVKSLDIVYITAGHFTTEDFSKEDGINWHEQQRMYITSAIAPVAIVHKLFHAGLLARGSKVVLVSSESGSITLRHESEGGGNYGHHASKAALNMAGKLLSLDTKEHGIVISVVHPGFMRTEMTKGVGFDKYWDDGGGMLIVHYRQMAVLERNLEDQLRDPAAVCCSRVVIAVKPDEAAKSLVEWTKDLDISKTGEYWAPRGPRDIGTAEATIGKNLPTPLQLPW